MSKKNVVIGITGRTGSGKSSACKWIKDNFNSVEHIDCDEIGHNVLKIKSIKETLVQVFGKKILKDNEINRPLFGEIVFNDKKKLIQLNQIVHPEICKKVYQIIKETTKKIIIIEGALIHQVGLEHICTHTICIDCPTKKILERSPNKKAILSKQPKSNDYINMCSHTIKNNLSVDLFFNKLAQLFERLSII